MKEIKKVPILTEMKGKTGYIAYKMDKQCAYNIYSTREKAAEKMSMPEYLKDYVNDNYGLKGYCIEVIIG